MKRSRKSKVDEFLLSQRIERLTDEQVTEKFIAKGKGRFGKKWRWFLRQLSGYHIPIEMIPGYYDTFLSMPATYDYTKSLLEKLTWEVRALSEDAVIIDGECRTGMNICCLASQFSDTNKEFHGYDKSKGMIILSEKRKERLKLDKVELYRGEHLEPNEKELQIADLVYTSNSRHKGIHGLKEYLEEFEAICRRIKPGGTYINAGYKCKIPKEYKDEISKMGITLQDEIVISKVVKDKTKEWQKENLNRFDNPFALQPPEVTKFYMNTFKVNLPE